MEPGLLREIRLLLPAWLADASTEADVWNHEDVRAADATGWLLRPDAVQKWRAAFASDVDAAMQQRVIDAIAAWHASLPREVSRTETLVWSGLTLGVSAPGDVPDAIAFAQRLEASVEAEVAGEGISAVLKRFGRSFLAGMPPGIYAKVPALATVWVASFDEGQVPAGVDPIAIRARMEQAGQLQHWAVRQVGRQLVFDINERGPAWPSHVEGPGSPVAWMQAARPVVVVERAGCKTVLVLEPGLSLGFAPDEPLVLQTDRCTVTIAPWRIEPWMVATGRDRYGLWADARISGVVQRFRWIPPGRFLMGSPVGEQVRSDDEGPQQWVTWSNGRWLGDTPVTQGLWTAVMGTNPSYFQSAGQSAQGRPVEQVHWPDSVLFCDIVGMRLPSEAEWEHACRAGTTGATWVGDVEILGVRNAPQLDPIAWYAGNCGVEYDLDKGVDATTWPEKQHEFARGGTRTVGMKSANPFGLYDMLGNVYEWCSDVYAAYGSGAKRVDEDAPRAVRGSGWFVNAAGIRAAFRFPFVASFRYYGLGLRLARDADVDAAKKGAT